MTRSQQANSGDDLSILRSTNRASTSSGRFFDNPYVANLVREKILLYEQQLESIRLTKFNNNVAPSAGSEVAANPSREFSLEDNNTLKEFLQLKIENLKFLLGDSTNNKSGLV